MEGLDQIIAGQQLSSHAGAWSVVTKELEAWEACGNRVLLRKELGLPGLSNGFSSE